jgi:DNA gyrase inhibitor GyrI
VSIVPANESKLVQKDTPPPSGGVKVETLKGGDYVRVWFNKGGNYYLVHLPNS